MCRTQASVAAKPAASSHQGSRTASSSAGAPTDGCQPTTTAERGQGRRSSRGPSRPPGRAGAGARRRGAGCWWSWSMLRTSSLPTTAERGVTLRSHPALSHPSWAVGRPVTAGALGPHPRHRLRTSRRWRSRRATSGPTRSRRATSGPTRSRPATSGPTTRRSPRRRRPSRSRSARPCAGPCRRPATLCRSASSRATRRRARPYRSLDVCLAQVAASQAWPKTSTSPRERDSPSWCCPPRRGSCRASPPASRCRCPTGRGVHHGLGHRARAALRRSVVTGALQQGGDVVQPGGRSHETA